MRGDWFLYYLYLVFSIIAIFYLAVITLLTLGIGGLGDAAMVFLGGVISCGLLFWTTYTLQGCYKITSANPGYEDI